MTLGQVGPTIVTKLTHQPHVLQHFLCNLFTPSSLRHNPFEDIMWELNALRVFPSLGVLLLELLEDLVDCVVVSGAVDSLPNCLLTIQKNALDEFASVFCGIIERNWRIAWDGQGEGPCIVRRSLAEHPPWKVRHEETWKEVGC